MTKPTKKPKAAPTYGQIMSEFMRITNVVEKLVNDLDRLGTMMLERERTRWKVAD